MRSKLRGSLFIILAILLFLSITYNFYSEANSLLGWAELLLGIALVFVGVGDQITKLSVSSSQIAIEQDVESQVKQLSNDNDYIDRFVDRENSDIDITKVVDETLEHRRDIWSRLLLIRITLRRLLRMLSDTAGIPYHDTTSITHMFTELQKAGLIDKFLVNQIEIIRRATFSVEWGTRSPASVDDINFTLKHYHEVFTALKQRAKEMSKSRITLQK
jgi:hypothetical protein